MRKGPLLRDSCRWILAHEDFKRWYCTEKAGVFWIKGDPGKGKTMLLCGTIEELEEFEEFEKLERIRRLSDFKLKKFSKLEEFGKFSKLKKFERLEILKGLEKLKSFDTDFHSANLVYYFCQAADCRANTAAAVIRGLIFSLLKQRPRLLTRIRKQFNIGTQLKKDKTLAILCEIFETIVWDEDFTRFFCVVDALDECIEDCDHLLNLIIKTSDTVKWLVSSRNEKHIERKLAKISLKLELESGQNVEQVSVSVDLYVDHHIQKIAAIKDDEPLQSKTSTILKDKASGTFLWVALVIEQLHNIDYWEVEDALEEVPKGLASIYGLLLDRIDKLEDKPREAYRVLLSIIAAAKRPLHLMELLIFTNGHWKGDKRFKTTYQLRDIRDMAKSYGSILSIRDDIVYFVHQSAKDYIMEAAPHRLFSVQHQHYKMFEVSLEAMSNILTYDIYNLKNPEIYIGNISPKTANADPLAPVRYCCAFWVEHLVQSCQFSGFEHEKYFKDDQILHSFLKEKFLCWVESLALMGSFTLHALPALQKLKKLIERYCENGSSQSAKRQREDETKDLLQFSEDACRFIIHSIVHVPYWPLQIYYAAIELEPDHSVIKETFQRTVRDRFGPLPAIFNLSWHRPSPLTRRTLQFPIKQEERTYFHYLTISPDFQSQRLGDARPIFTTWCIQDFETGIVDEEKQGITRGSLSYYEGSINAD
jgi:hypothetical protein